MEHNRKRPHQVKPTLYPNLALYYCGKRSANGANTDRSVRAPCLLEPYLYSSVENAAFGVGVEFGEGWVLVRGKDDLGVAALAFIEDIFGIDEEAEFAECFLAEKADLGRVSGQRSIVERLTAAVIKLDAGLKALVFFPHERRIYLVFWKQRKSARPRQIAGLCVGERIADEKFGDAVFEPAVRLKAFADNARRSIAENIRTCAVRTQNDRVGNFGVEEHLVDRITDVFAEGSAII